MPPLFSAYCLSQPLSVSYLECCISKFYRIIQKRLSKSPVILFSWQTAFEDDCPEAYISMTDLQQHIVHEYTYISGVAMPLLDVTAYVTHDHLVLTTQGFSQ